MPDFNSQPDKDENDPFIAKTNIWNKFQTNGKLLGGLAVLDKHSIKPFYHYRCVVNVITNAMCFMCDSHPVGKKNSFYIIFCKINNQHLHWKMLLRKQASTYSLTFSNNMSICFNAEILDQLSSTSICLENLINLQNKELLYPCFIVQW